MSLQISLVTLLCTRRKFQKLGTTVTATTMAFAM